MKFQDFVYRYGLRPLVYGFTRGYRFQVKGAEHIPRGTNFIVVANHLSYLDAPILSYAFYPRQIRWIIDKKIYYDWKFHYISAVQRGIPVNGSTKHVLEATRKGDNVGIFPQGGICCGQKIIKEGRTGAAIIALRAGLPVVPCFIEGQVDTTRKVNVFPRIGKPLTIRIGKPLMFDKLDTETIDEDIIQTTLQEIISAVNRMSPFSRVHR